MEISEYERAHLNALRKENAGCTVLLRKDGTFPLKEAGKIALYGSGARNTIKGGTGSGEVNSRFFTTVEQGLTDAGFTITTKDWLDSYDGIRAKAKKDFHREIKEEAKKTHQQAIIVGMGAVMPEPDYEIPVTVLADTAIYVLSRISGEGADRKAIPGDILLTQTEIRDIRLLNQSYPQFMLVLNVGGVVDLTPVADVKNILLLGQLGAETGAVLADLLLGKSYPSGKLTATWAATGDYYPAQIGQDDTEYSEGIYVGYRYFDAAKKTPLFPFGYGLGYTDFSVGATEISMIGDTVSVTTEVQNIGQFPGREVLQVYLHAPAGKIRKPMWELCGFAKTEEILPGNTEKITSVFRLSDMACFDESNHQWLLEAGNYILNVGTNSRDHRSAAILYLPKDTVTAKVLRIGAPEFPLWEPEDCLQPDIPGNLPVICVDPQAIPFADKTAAPEFEISEEIHALSDEELVKANVGAFDPTAGIASIIGTASLSVPGAAGETVSLGEGAIVMADGPAGLRLSQSFYRDKKGIHVLGSTMPESIAAFLPGVVRFFLNRQPKLKKGTVIEHQYATAIPIGTCVAQSWDTAFAALCGSIVGQEMQRFGIHLWLAPALNIHRTPLCGRNFEYYSEDPLLSGKMAAAVTCGVQQNPGCGVTIKHFCANSQETNRYNSNSIVSERALREIYLKGFGIAIREASPAAVMTSYNLVNGIHTSQHKPLLDHVLRREFGHRSLIMTDWVTGGSVLSKNAKYPVPDAGMVAAAGGDLFMPGCKKDVGEIQKALADGRLSRKQLEINVTRILSATDHLHKEG